MRLFYGWYVVGAMIVAISFGLGLTYFNNPVFYPAYIDEFHWSRAAVVSGGSVNFILFGILSPFVGILADRFSVKKIILAGVVCDALSRISFSFMNSIPYYYLANVLVGVGIACMSMLTVKLLIAKWFKRREGRALGLVIASTAVGGGIGPSLTSYLLTQHGWREVHLILSALLLGVALPIFLLVAKETPQEMGLFPDGVPLEQSATSQINKDSFPPNKNAPPTGLTLRQALTTRTFWVFCTAILLFYICIISIFQHFVLHLTDLGLNLASASAALSLLLAISILGSAGFGALSDRYSKKQLIIVACLLLAVMSLALFLMSVPSLPPFVRSATAVYAIATLIGIGFGGVEVSIPLVAGECFGLPSLGKILGIILIFNALGGILGPLVAGYLFDISGSYQLAFFLISLAGFAAAGCLSFIKTEPSTRPAQSGHFTC